MASTCDVVLPNGVRCLAREILRAKIDFRAGTLEADVAYWQSAADQANGIPPVGMDYPRVPLSEMPAALSGDIESAIGVYLASQSETLAGVQQRGCDVIDAAAGAARARFVTVSSAQDSTYTAKYAQAQAYIAAGSPDDASAYSWIAAEATATGKTPKETAEIIVAAGDKWANEIGPKIEGTRIAAKDKISASTTVDAALDAMREGLATLQAIQ